MKARVSEACLRALSLGRWSGIVMLLSVATLSAQSVSFEAPRELAAGRGSMFVAVGDFNLDGVLDLVVSNFNSTNILVLQGNGDGTFQPGVQFALGRFASAVAVGDFNSDGKLDVAIAIPTNDGSVGVSVLLNNTPL
jgi:hypothetical protein